MPVGAGGVCLRLYLRKLLESEIAVEIHGHEVMPHVESDIVVPVFFMHKPGHNMLTRVILHPTQTLFPVKHAVVLCADYKRSVYIMQYPAVFLTDVRNLGIAYASGVGSLSPALREKGSSVKLNGDASVLLGA